MILEFFIDIFLNIASFLLSTSTSAMAGIDIKGNLLEAFNFLSEAFVMAGQFCHFLLGDYLIIILPLLIPLLIYKYVGYPIIAFLRGFIRWGN